MGIAMMRCHMPTARQVDKTTYEQTGTLTVLNAGVIPVATIQHTALYLHVIRKACLRRHCFAVLC